MPKYFVKSPIKHGGKIIPRGKIVKLAKADAMPWAVEPVDDAEAGGEAGAEDAGGGDDAPGPMAKFRDRLLSPKADK